MSSFNDFFLGFQSYLSVSKEMSGGPEFLSGIGRKALEIAPDIFTKFGDIRDILEIRWKWKDDITPAGAFTKGFTPYSYNRALKINSLYLPVTQVDMPVSVISGEVKPFRRNYGEQPVNLVVYKDSAPTLISLGLYLRNDTFSPWVAVFTRAMNSIVNYGVDTVLVIPRFNRDQLKSGGVEYKVKVRLVNFNIGNAMQSVTPAALVLIPDVQNLDLFNTAGIV